jgi:hypothetical protein
MNFESITKERLLKRIGEACDTYRHYVEERRVLMELTGMLDSSKYDREQFDAFVADNGVAVPKRPSGHNGGRKKKVPEQEQEEPEPVGASIESSPLPDAPAEAPETAAEQLLVLDRALVQAAYRMQSETYQFQLDEMEKRITQLKEEVEKLWTEVDQYRERIEECDRLIAEIEQAETVALR